MQSEALAVKKELDALAKGIEPEVMKKYEIKRSERISPFSARKRAAGARSAAANFRLQARSQSRLAKLWSAITATGYYIKVSF